MSFAKAVYELRKHLNLTQEGLARELQSTLKTVARYESGTVEPRGKFLDTLAFLAETGKRNDLARVFVEKRQEAVRRSLNASLKHSPETARRIPYWELESIDRSVDLIQKSLTDIKSKIGNRKDLLGPVNDIQHHADNISRRLNQWLGINEVIARGDAKEIASFEAEIETSVAKNPKSRLVTDAIKQIEGSAPRRRHTAKKRKGRTDDRTR